MSKDICRYNRGKDHNYTCELSHLARYGDKTYYGTCGHEPCPCLLSKIKSLEDYIAHLQPTGICDICMTKSDAERLKYKDIINKICNLCGYSYNTAYSLAMDILDLVDKEINRSSKNY